MRKKRLGGSRSSSSVLNQKRLSRRLQSFQRRSHSTVDEIVEQLRTKYPDYKRIKQQPFTRAVQQALHSSSKASSHSVSDFTDDDEHAIAPSSSSSSPSHSRKKPRRTDETEQRVKRVEGLHIKRNKIQHHSTSFSDSDSSSSSEEAEDGAVSSSEDAIYGQEEEAELDLMKSMLRQNYIQSNNTKSKPGKKNIEVEVATIKSENKIDIINEGGTANKWGAELKKETKVGVAADGVEVKGKERLRFCDLGGMGGMLKKLYKQVIVPLIHPQMPRCLGISPTTGILLHGPPGCGKTTLAHAIANESGVTFYKISATELVSGVSGASEENIRELFSKAYRTAPSIVFIDEIDAIASKRENLQRETDRRIVTQLMTCMDESSNLESSDSKYVLVIGATNRPDAVDPALRRPGRFDREIFLGVPDENARHEILSVLTRNLKLEGSFDLWKIAKATPGFVGTDLVALAKEAGNLAMERIVDQREHDQLSKESNDKEQADDWLTLRLRLRQPWLPEEMEKLAITMADFEEAAKMVQPSTRREGFSTIPNVKWEDVGGLDFIRQQFDRDIVRRIKFPEKYAKFGLHLATGFLLYGPPGCGKTLIAKALANEAGANFIHIKGAELLDKYVGESELAVRTLFSRARTCSPCIIFFDEVDALTTKCEREEGGVVQRLLKQLLIELDGGDERHGVYVIGATNRPGLMDDAVLRHGRFGNHLYVPLPGPNERGLILKAIARTFPVDDTVDLSAIGRACENFSGADLLALMYEAAKDALDETFTSAGISETIKTYHFERALNKISPSVSVEKTRF